MLSKRAGISEAMTWVIATIIIFVVLAIFIYAANAMGTYRSYTVSSGEVEIEVNSQIDVKTEIAFEKSNYENQETIENWIEGVEKYG